MSVHIVRFRISPEHIEMVTQQIEAIFTALREAASSPSIRYVALRDDVDPVFTLILELPEGAANPLLSIPEALAFRESLAGWAHDDAAPRSNTVVGRYCA